MMAMLQAARDGRAREVIWLPACVLTMAACAWLYPSLLPFLLVALLAAGLIALAWRHPTEAWVLWLLVAGLSAEMTMTDLAGPEAFQATITVVKGGEIGLVALMIVRFGITADWLNPAWGFAWIAAAGMVVGLSS
jgi:hypothetical protein